MKRPMIALFLMMSLVLISGFSHAAFAVSKAPTTTMVKSATEPSAMEDATRVTASPLDYMLPYPGILSDHPLYFLKTLRDRVMEKLIADPVRKMEFYVLQADKQVNMGIFLTAKNKTEFSLAAIQMGEVYMDRAVTIATTMKEQGKEVPQYVTEKMTKAIHKHEEVVTNLKDQNVADSATAYDSILKTMQSIEEKIAQLQ